MRNRRFPLFETKKTAEGIGLPRHFFANFTQEKFSYFHQALFDKWQNAQQ